MLLFYWKNSINHNIVDVVYFTITSLLVIATTAWVCFDGSFCFFFYEKPKFWKLSSVFSAVFVSVFFSSVLLFGNSTVFFHLITAATISNTQTVKFIKNWYWHCFCIPYYMLYDVIFYSIKFSFLVSKFLIRKILT